MKAINYYILLSSFILFAYSAYGQKKLAFDLGLSLNLTDRTAIRGFNFGQAVENYAKPLVGYGVNAKVITQLDGLINFSFGAGFRSNRIREEAPMSLIFTSTDLYVFAPFLLHFRLTDQFELNIGASYDYLLSRKRKFGAIELDETGESRSRHTIVPRVDLSYQLNGSIDFNLSYHLGLQEGGKVEFIDVDGRTSGFSKFKDQYFQMAVFYRVFGYNNIGEK